MHQEGGIGYIGIKMRPWRKMKSWVKEMIFKRDNLMFLQK